MCAIDDRKGTCGGVKSYFVFSFANPICKTEKERQDR